MYAYCGDLKEDSGDHARQEKKEAEDYARTGLKSLTVWVEAGTSSARLKILAAERPTYPCRRSLTEFLNDGLEKYGKARVG